MGNLGCLSPWAKRICLLVLLSFSLGVSSPAPVRAGPISKKILAPCVIAVSLLASCSTYRGLGEHEGVKVVTPTYQGDFAALLRGSKISELPSNEDREFLKAVKRFESTYPSSFVQKYLDEICIGKECLDPWTGDAEGGLFVNTRPNEILVSYANQSRYQETLHHEFAHLLMHRYESNRFETQWSRGSAYTRQSYHDYQASPVSMTTERLYSRGFLSNYAARNFDEDFAVTAAALFTGTIPWRDLSAYPLLERKVALAVLFYHSLDSKMDEDFFRGRAGLKPRPKTGDEDPSMWQRFKNSLGI